MDTIATASDKLKLLKAGRDKWQKGLLPASQARLDGR